MSFFVPGRKNPKLFGTDGELVSGQKLDQAEVSNTVQSLLGLQLQSLQKFFHKVNYFA